MVRSGHLVAMGSGVGSCNQKTSDKDSRLCVYLMFLFIYFYGGLAMKSPCVCVARPDLLAQVHD